MFGAYLSVFSDIELDAITSSEKSLVYSNVYCSHENWISFVWNQIKLYCIGFI